MSKGGVSVVAVLASLLSSAAFAEPPPPIDAYAALQISSPRLSPDGNSIAMIGVADHFFSQGSDRTAWLAALEKLLAANLQKPQTAAGSGQP